jgi:hypothetical protein
MNICPVLYDISQQLSNTISAVPSGCPIAFKIISQWLSAKTWQFASLFSEVLHFCLQILKVEEAVQYYKNPQRLLF